YDWKPRLATTTRRLRRSAPRRLKLTPADRIFWGWLRRVWSDWKSALMIVKVETVVAWHRKGFRGVRRDHLFHSRHLAAGREVRYESQSRGFRARLSLPAQDNPRRALCRPGHLPARRRLLRRHCI